MANQERDITEEKVASGWEYFDTTNQLMPFSKEKKELFASEIKEKIAEINKMLDFAGKVKINVNINQGYSYDQRIAIGAAQVQTTSQITNQLLQVDILETKTY